jgi:superfamily II DNA or RNA helicase
MSQGVVRIRIDSRVRVSAAELGERAAELVRAGFAYQNPAYRKGGRLTGEPPVIRTWRQDGDELSVPRGGIGKVREVLRQCGRGWAVDDLRTWSHPEPGFPRHRLTLRPYQQRLIDAAAEKQNCLLRAPTGSGKTCAAFGLLARLKRRSIVMVWTGNLLDQWRERCGTELGLSGDDVGIIRGPECRIRPITLAMQQSVLSRLGGAGSSLAGAFDVLVFDEVQRAAADSLCETVDQFSARYRVGISADHCVAKGTNVVMADGERVPIELIRSGDFVDTPLGPKEVKSVIFTGLLETVVVRGRGVTFRCTGATKLGTASGWVHPKSTCYPFVHESVQSMWQADEVALRDPLAYGVQTEQLRLGLEMSAVRPSRPGGEGAQRAFDQAPKVDALGEGEDEAYRSSAGINFGCDEGTHGGTSFEAQTATRGGIEDARSTGKDGRDDPQAVSCRSEEVGLDVRCIGQRSSAAKIGACSCGYPEESGVQTRTCCRDGEGSNSSASLQARLCGCAASGCSRDRRECSSEIGRARCGCAKRREVGEVGLDRDTVRGDVRSLEVAGRRCAVVRAEVDDDRLILPKFDLSVDGAECFFAEGVLVHNTRKDEKEFVTHDLFGSVAAEVGEGELIEQGAIVGVEVRVVPTDFKAPWYRYRQDWNLLLEKMCADPARNELAVSLARQECRAGERCLLFSHRVEHARWLDADLCGSGVPGGVLLGGVSEAEVFERTKAGLKDGDLMAGTGTYQAIAQGLDLPAVSRGICVTPVGNNRQQFGQVKGRICRQSAGKEYGILYYLLDSSIYGTKPIKNFLKWGYRVRVRAGGTWVEGTEYLKRANARSA